MRKNLGIVERGFVGTAVLEGMSHAFPVHSYDKAKGYLVRNGGEERAIDTDAPFDLLLRCVNGPVFVCVPTPMNPDGGCNTAIVESVVAELAGAASRRWRTPTVVIKSTVEPGTTQRLADKYGLPVVFNPEFLTERNAIADFKNQDRIVLGGDPAVVARVAEYYALAYPGVPILTLSATEAEMVKYLANCFLATKVSFANEMKNLCDRLDISYEAVVNCARSDSRLGTSHWAVPGPDGRQGFGGSCFPKDVNAILALASRLDLEMYTLRGAWSTNLTVRPGRDWEQLKGRAVT